ncbi:MAG: encapsulin-associated ferritin-like protein [Gammaproteobacteria bacterium]|nr:ferritin [Gammaproteobacteria bacterium]MBA3731326.1 ferritin [Gammaproteobacteria bacterium]
MAGASESYHEPVESLSESTRDMHRALVSLQEELEAVDWYRQRADAASDKHLRNILLHNMREEMEHACMVLEWLRRNNDDLDEQLKTYLFSKGPITEVEDEAMYGGDATPEMSTARPAAESTPTMRLTVGSLKGM